ncbi:hypothetical protein AB833_19835 [Chromatiales bacterium (ex Bugula neritina AB1)]|nr:hypothetical protein AB833_19835 [Chromatiales bacterium (ex Bugula neritina AB1)]
MHWIQQAVSTKQTFKISVKKLVEFACRTGDLVSSGPAGPTAAEGQRAHRELQQLRNSNEQAEIKVTATVDIGDNQLLISGRVDLLDDNTRQPAIGEIKSCYVPPEKIPPSTKELHWAQLKIYGFCVLQKAANENQSNDDSGISLRVIWANLIDNKTTIEQAQFGFAELEEFTRRAAETYINWIKIIDSYRKRLRETAADLQFPYVNFRAGQREMAAGIYVCARDRRSLLCEAPTGIGKTISALFPSVKSIGEKHIDNIIYLTAKTSGRTAANTSIAQLQSAGLEISSITITAKKTTCHCSNGTCTRNDDGRCPLTIGFFDRLPAAQLHLISIGVISPESIDEAAHKYKLCPFELTLQMLPWATIVICDYNYVFDPLVRLSHFSDHANQTLVLIDEAHNLIDRARSMYSAKLDREQIKSAIADIDDKNSPIAKQLSGVVNSINRWSGKSDCDESEETDKPATITRAVGKCTDAMQQLTENNTPMTENIADVAKELYRYLVIEDLFGDQHRTITVKSRKFSKHGKKSLPAITVKLQCLNATDRLKRLMKQFRTTVAFSATLRPQHFFRSSLGLPENTHCMSLLSPFDSSRQASLFCDWVDTRYVARDQAIKPIVEIAHHVYRAHRGNYQIFFPSYAFMNRVHQAFVKKYPAIPTAIQQRNSDETTRRDFLQQFDDSNATLGFAILGGIFGEGVDYTGDKLIGTIIVGTGLASISLEQQLIEQDFNNSGLNGFDYASRYPGFTRVLQTAGRVIRSETDKGVVVLIDKRFNKSFYRNLFPQHWNLLNCDNTDTLNHQLQQFWSGQQSIF